MKRVTLILGVAFLMTLALSSCKKDWVCECTSGGVSASVTLTNVTKADATTACENGSIMGVVCKIK